jgi:hypothetical protein
MMTIALTEVAATLLLLFGGGGQNVARPAVPQKLAVPETDAVVLQAHASGVQIYACQAGTDQKLSWVLKAPDAELFDSNGKSIGHHFAGPTWKHNDGSEVTGKAAAREDAPEPDAIPWLLVTVTSHSGTGVLSRVTTIQRIHTKGGQPPAAGCDDSHRGAESKSPYSADYYFYAPAH